MNLGNVFFKLILNFMIEESCLNIKYFKQTCIYAEDTSRSYHTKSLIKIRETSIISSTYLVSSLY